VSDLTPGTLRREGLHSRECRRYIVGRANTSAADCTCWIGAYADAWAADCKARDYYVAEMRLAEDRAEKAEARIEALEKEIDIGEVEGDIGAHRLHELRAALRGEEKER